MEDKHKLVLQRCRIYTIDKLSLPDEVLDHLLEEQIFNEDDIERISKEVTTKDKNRKILDLLPRRGPRAFTVFLSILHQRREFSVQTQLELYLKQENKIVDDFNEGKITHFRATFYEANLIVLEMYHIYYQLSHLAY